MAAYEAAMSGPRTAIGTGRIKPGSWPPSSPNISIRNNSSPRRSAGTQRMRRGILERFRAAYGDRPFALLPPEWIEALLDAKPPHAARSWLVTLRSLCQFALKRGWLRADPTRDIKLRAIKGDGFHTWTDDEIAQFEAHHPIGTKPRLALALLLYTAQRRSDVVRMGRQHIKDGVLTVKQQKTGVTLAIPVHPHLQTVLDATPSEHLTFLVTATGKPYGGNAFSEQFRNWCDAAGLPKRCKPHGLRKAACRRLAEAGCSAQRDHGDQRTRDDERARPLHRRRRSGAARPQCDDEGGHPMTRREFITLLAAARRRLGRSRRAEQPAQDS